MRQIVAQVVVGLEKLTSQLNSFKLASEDVVGNLKENLSKEVTQKLSVSKQKVNQLTESLEEPKKSVDENIGLLRNLMVGIENMGENVKNIQKEMTIGEIQKSWRLKKN